MTKEETLLAPTDQFMNKIEEIESELLYQLTLEGVDDKSPISTTWINRIRYLLSLLDEKEKEIEAFKGAAELRSHVLENCLTRMNKAENRVKKLEKEIELLQNNALQLHDGCIIQRDEEYTKLESEYWRENENIRRRGSRKNRLHGGD
jgi:hypothetical protein